MSRLTNEKLQEIAEFGGMTASILAKELLELRKLRDSAGECPDINIFMRDYMAKFGVQPTYSEVSKWQHQQSQLAYAALMKDAERLKAALEKAEQRANDLDTAMRHDRPELAQEVWQHQVNEIIEALTAFREKYPIK